MAEIALGLVEPVVKWVGAPILRQFKYLWYFTTNITNLKNEAKNLQDKEQDLQRKVQAAENNVGVISSEVESWLRDSKEIMDKKDAIIDEVQNLKGGCLKLRARFSLSKRAKETADRLKELKDRCKVSENSIALPRPPPATKAVPLERTYEFESRKEIEDAIIATLRGGDVNMIGICGMGGLGKTTMAKKIWNSVLVEEHVFEEVAMAVVSRPVEELRIQLEIGRSLGLELEGESSQGRAQKLHKRLSDTKRTLVILDDVWETLKLEDLGIPRDNKRCKILLTSRKHDVLSTMKVQEIFGMKVLSEEDSWFLFKEGAGTCVDDTKLNSIAKKIVNECKGLPIALTTVGAALKDQMKVPIWEDALEQLRGCEPDIPEIITNIYSPLRLSYDGLTPNQKSIFLLCCLFPEDAHIPLEILTYFCMGLSIFGRGNKNARNKICALTEKLKSQSLLLDSESGDDYVRMHDVIRDVCIFIARKEGYLSDNDRNWTSSLQRYEPPSGLGLLWISDSANKEFKFDGIRDLRVLIIEKCSLTSLPFTQMPKNLTTLVLDACRGLKTLYIVGELVNLEILICRDCDSIEELPPEIQGLNRLKVLDLTRCGNLQRIGRGIISNLVGLEELKMLRSFKKWEGEDRKQRENAGLKELEVLTKLRCLEIEIEDLALAAENIRLSSEVDRFTIRFSYQSPWFSKLGKYLSNKKMILNLEGATRLGYWIEMQLLRDTECLLLVGNGANEVGRLTNLGKQIRYLELGECESMKKVVTSSMDERGATVFPSIEHLNLFKLPKLEEICDDRISSNSFQNLKRLTLVELPVLKQLWKSSQNDSGKDFLPQLEVLEIRSCEMMEAVFLWKGEEANENNSYHTTKRFPKLKELVLDELPNLISLCQGIEGIEFPLMRKIEIKECWEMKGMVWNEKISGGSSNNASIHAHFCPQQVLFGCLKKLDTDRNPFSELEELQIIGCQGIQSLFTPSMVKDDEEKGMSGGQRALLFPKLHTLLLIYLPKLVSFCESKGIESIQFPVLRSMVISGCGKMKGMVANGVTSNENNSGGSSTNAADTHCIFCESQQVSFGCLKRLHTRMNPFCSHTIHVSIFNGLEELSISTGNLSLFSSSIAENLVNLKELSIEDCFEMVEVIKDDEEKGMSCGGQRAPLLFPKLQLISLSGLSKLVSFCELKCDVEFPSLREVVIRNCPNMKNFTLGSLAAPNLESFNTDLNNYLLQVPFISLKKLWIERNEKPLNCYQIHGSVFDRLEVLNIKWYLGSMSLFSSSITGNLVNLTTLTIAHCYVGKMVKVIEEEEEKEKVVSGAQRTTILFPKLHKIVLINLPELVRFCEWKCEVEFPSLMEVEINRCRNMKSCTAGLLTTPNLKSVKIEDEEFGEVKDLNGLVQKQYLRRGEETTDVATQKEAPAAAAK